MSPSRTRLPPIFAVLDPLKDAASQLPHGPVMGRIFCRVGFKALAKRMDVAHERDPSSKPRQRSRWRRKSGQARLGEVRELSRKRYGRPMAEFEADIRTGASRLSNGRNGPSLVARNGGMCMTLLNGPSVSLPQLQGCAGGELAFAIKRFPQRLL
jgi:hypothetical protein